MGTFYSVSFCITPLPGREEEAASDLKFEVTQEDDGLFCSVAEHMSYSAANELDEEVVKAVLKYHDFDKGIVIVTSNGNDYDNGPLDWAIGPWPKVQEWLLKERRTTITQIQAEIEAIEATQLPNKMVQTLDLMFSFSEPYHVEVTEIGENSND